MVKAAAWGAKVRDIDYASGLVTLQILTLYPPAVSSTVAPAVWLPQPIYPAMNV
jgi:hypothetical protein